jgi:stage III sporulation protein SpoIIIAA
MWNMEEKKIQGFEQAVRVLPLRLRQEAMALPADQRARVEELRLRWGRPMAAVLPEGERPLGGEPVTGQELEQLLADNAFAMRLAETAAEEPAAPDDKPQLPE